MTDTNELFDSRELQAERSFTSRDMLRIVFKHKLAILICFFGVSLIVAFAIFMLIKAINSLKNKEEEKPVIVQKEEVVLLAEIRDLLKK